MHSQPINFDRLRDDDISILSAEVCMDILDSFESVLQSSPEPNVDEKTASFISKFLASTPKEDPPTGVTKEFLWDGSQTLIRLASFLPCEHYGQEILLKTIRYLDDEEPLWKGLKEFSMSLREEWNHTPTHEQFDEDDDGREYTLAEWQNVNAFLAKLFNTLDRGYPYGMYPVWEIRVALEGYSYEDESTKALTPAIIDTRVRVACIWIQLNGRRLLEESLLNAATIVRVGGKPLATGPLFQGSIGFTLERWGFWKRRLVEICEDFDEPVRVIIDKTVQIMSDLEKEVMTKAFGKTPLAVNGSDDAAVTERGTT